MSDNKQYPYSIKMLSDEDGGGFFIEYPDIEGCFSDGETLEEAIANGEDALACWIATAEEDGDLVPLPFSHLVY